jgi:basic amino acid/polyamine antiporter, APA family
VSAGVWVMRRSHPHLNRPFRTPMVPLVPILAIAFSGLLIVSLSYLTQIRLLVWLIIGLIIYFTYGIRHSRVRNALK